MTEVLDQEQVDRIVWEMVVAGLENAVEVLMARPAWPGAMPLRP